MRHQGLNGLLFRQDKPYQADFRQLDIWQSVMLFQADIVTCSLCSIGIP